MIKTAPTIVHRGKLVYVLYPEKIIVGIGMGQWVSYNQYDNWNRQGITKFRKAILHSRENEYTTPAEQMTLAHECEIRGTSTSQPKDLEV